MRDACDEEAPGVWTWLMAWYSFHCDGDWEHQHGIHIETLDNPGSHLQIDLEDTDLATVSYQPREVHRSETRLVPNSD